MGHDHYCEKCDDFRSPHETVVAGPVIRCRSCGWPVAKTKELQPHVDLAETEL